MRLNLKNEGVEDQASSRNDSRGIALKPIEHFGYNCSYFIIFVVQYLMELLVVETHFIVMLLIVLDLEYIGKEGFGGAVAEYIDDFVQGYLHLGKDQCTLSALGGWEVK